jgi:hypothetical protein
MVATPAVTLTPGVAGLAGVSQARMPVLISSAMSASVRLYTASTSARLTIPARQPPESTTGRRLTLRRYMILAACSTLSPGAAV